MKIGCLGWGSLIWNPENLLIRRLWFDDGPLIPIEFARQSQNGRLTLVITDDAQPVRSLWTLMATEDLNVAINSLQIREGVPKSKSDSLIGVVKVEDVTDIPIKLIIQKWAKIKDLDAVIWTNLKPNFGDKKNETPSLKDALDYLSSLDINKKIIAEEYIRKAPKQIDTDFRREFEKLWNWKPAP